MPEEVKKVDDETKADEAHQNKESAKQSETEAGGAHAHAQQRRARARACERPCVGEHDHARRWRPRACALRKRTRHASPTHSRSVQVSSC
eukprot:6206938-Pleurochrysis_carterae.AAC.3